MLLNLYIPLERTSRIVQRIEAETVVSADFRLESELRDAGKYEAGLLVPGELARIFIYRYSCWQTYLHRLHRYPNYVDPPGA